MLQLWRYVQALLGILFRHPLTGTGIIPVLPDGRIVLIRKQNSQLWGFPGGMVNWGEDIPTTIKRELTEETGLELIQMGRLVGVYSHPERDVRFHAICVVVVAQVAGTFQPQDTLEIAEVRAFTVAEIPKDQMFGDGGQHFQDYLDGITAVA